KKWTATDKKRANALLPHGGKRGVDLARRAGIEVQQLLAEAARSLMRFALHARGFGKVRIKQLCDNRSVGNEFVQQPKPLAGEQVTEPAHSRDIAARPVEATDIALLDGVATSGEHNGNGLGRRHGSQYRSATSCRGDHGHPT